jgi:hypothetical protein
MLFLVPSIEVVACLAQTLEWPMPEPLLVASVWRIVVYLSGRGGLASGFAALT